MFYKKTIRDIDVHGKTVLVRVDYNVPLETDKDGHVKVADDYRIKMSLPTLNYLRDRDCKVILCSHLGRPGGERKPELSLRPVADQLSKIIEDTVAFADDCVGDAVDRHIRDLQPGGVLLLENLRYHKEEKDNDVEFARQLAYSADYFVQNAFGVVHRSHASTTGVTHFLPSFAGLLIEKEVMVLQAAIEKPKKPVVAVIGGSKIHTKIDLLDNLMSVADTLIIGGAMANTFLVARGYNVGKSLYDKDELSEADKIMHDAEQSKTEVYLPFEGVAVSQTVEEGAVREEVPTDQVGDNDIILDFGEGSTQRTIDIVSEAGTVLWNGPLGMVELDGFRQASEQLARFLVEHHTDSIVGGGDTAGFVDELGLVDGFTHVSTGGGASLELLAGKKLPGVEALMDA